MSCFSGPYGLVKILNSCSKLMCRECREPGFSKKVKHANDCTTGTTIYLGYMVLSVFSPPLVFCLFMDNFFLPAYCLVKFGSLLCLLLIALWTQRDLLGLKGTKAITWAQMTILSITHRECSTPRLWY